jgi:glutamate dehydrogenase
LQLSGDAAQDGPAPPPTAAAVEDADAQTLLADADRILGGSAADAPPDFATRIFCGASAEDVLRYQAAELAEIAAGIWRFLGQRRPQTPSIRIVTPPPTSGTRLPHISVIDIVNDDMPFLFDSVMAVIADEGLDVHLAVHPLFTVERDAAGRLAAFRGDAAPGGAATRESVIEIHVDRVDDDTVKAAIVDRLGVVLADVRRAVEDWHAMLARVTALIAGLRNAPPALSADEVDESIQFLEWLMDDNFTFLGMRDYRFEPSGKVVTAVSESSLGTLRPREGGTVGGGRLELSPHALAAFHEPKMLLLTKTNSHSRVHRRAAMDQVVVKHYDPDGKMTGAFQILGLFTSTAYVRSTRSIPYVRRKVARVMARAGFSPAGHSGKALANILETYPRDELMQIDEDMLLAFARTILKLNERPRVRVLPRRDAFERFVSVLVYAPRDRYDSTTRAAIGRLLATAYNGRMESSAPSFPEGMVVRVHFVIARHSGDLARPERAEVEAAVSRLVKTWPDRLIEALTGAHDPVTARALFATYGGAFSAAYQEAFAPEAAVADIAALEALSAHSPLGTDFARGEEAQASAARLKVWSYGRPIPLSERVPVLEQMGFTVVDESTYHVHIGAGDRPNLWLHDMVLERRDGGPIDLDAAKQRLDSCFAAVMRGEAENDGHNALVLAAGLDWREVALLRTLSRYLRQIGVPYSQGYLAATLVKHATIAARIMALFALRFDPSLKVTPQERDGREADAAAEIETRLAKVDSLDEDRIIREYRNAVQAAVRTNFYQQDDGRPKPAIAIKFDSRKVTGMPLPRPHFEIFLCSPRLEAVHLRMGPVARGGIRWSDRPQDFRTEVLGLVKAQQVKNAVIVPVGAKGGFVPKQLPAGAAGNREAIQAEGTAIYRIFMQTLLDLTENLDVKEVVPPKDVVRHDGDDPYLVVAADKGTATFSDLANEVAREHGYWLDDAFASGGSAGYDHKQIGITARGAWESVKRHFHEMGTDISKAPFTVAGIGDMSGDVFGNGMLRERTIRLIAAFDHRDIFIDPSPDAGASFKERQRLFDLPRSSWQDFDRSVISAGGGIYSRHLKEIELSGQARAALGIAAAKATPEEVMTAILKAPVDLFWFGGIGTFVRGEAEANAAAGDRANDAIRIAAADLRCKVIGEGANLGVTQRGRIEAALAGIRLNTDAIDNSAGVNTSDVEVNLKIALSVPMHDGRLARPERDALLHGMTEEVAALVLRNNYQQTLALSLAQRRGLDDLDYQQRLMQFLEKRALLDRALEFLPTDMEIVERRRRAQPLTRPELAVLLAYAKLALHEELLRSSVPDDSYLSGELLRYFPHSVSTRFPDALAQHRLRRHIISTRLANSMINRGGPALVVRIADQTGAAVDRIAAAFAVVRDSFGLTALNAAIEATDNAIAGAVQLGLFAAVQDLLLDRIVWFLRNVDLGQGLAGIIEHYRSGIAIVQAGFDRLLPEDAQRACAAAAHKMTSEGVPEPLARSIAHLRPLGAAADAVLIAERTGRPVEEVASIYFAAVSYFQLSRIFTAAGDIKLSDYFDRLAFDRALDAIRDASRRLAAAMASSGGRDTAAKESGGADAAGRPVGGAEAVTAWVERIGEARSGEVERARHAVHEIAASGLTLSKLTVAAGMLGDLASDVR